MLTTPTPRSQVSAHAGQPAGPIRLAATGGGTLVLATDDALWTRPNIVDGAFRSLPLSWAPKHVAVSPTGRFAAAVSATGNQGEVFDAASGGSLLKLGDPTARRHSLVLALMGTPQGDVLLMSRQRSTLDVLSLPGGAALSRADRIPPVPFTFGSLHPMLDGDTVVAIGHNEAESKDSLITLSIRDMIEGVGKPVAPGPITDYAYRLAAGPVGSDAVIIYRDPEDDEVSDCEEDAPAGKLCNFHGLYVRRTSDGAFLERIVCDAPLQSGMPLLGMQATILASADGTLLSVPRNQPSAVPSQVVQGGAIALDASGRRAVFVSTVGEVQVFEGNSAVMPVGTTPPSR